jgi:hypothetical protein
MRFPVLLSSAALMAAIAVSAHAEPDAIHAEPDALRWAVTPLAAPIPPEPPPPTAEWWRAGGPRLRPTDSRLALLLRLGRERSTLLADLADRVEAGNVVVYLELNKDLGPRLAGRLTFVAHADPYRYLRVSLNPDRPSDLIIASIAHELQHVLEIQADPQVRSESSLVSLYRRIGKSNRIGDRIGWETDAAQEAGRAVRRELTAGPASSVARRE